MSSTQDVRYSAAKVQQGLDLANKLWNASRLILLNAPEVDPAPSPAAVEDRWILSRLQRAIELVSGHLDAYDFAHAALDLYRFFWSELCDWYLEIVKPRLNRGEPEVGATLLWVLEQTLALAHPVMPFATEEIYSYLRAGGPEGPEMMVVHPYPEVDPALLDREAEQRVEGWLELTRSVRRWRALVGVPAGSRLPAQVASDDERPHELVARLARLSFDGADGETLASFGPVEILASGDVDATQVRRRVTERCETLRSEIDRAESKLANQGVVANAPREVVEAERAKLASYEAELQELGC
jgi:valyl-tRNA synthetase